MFRATLLVTCCLMACPSRSAHPQNTIVPPGAGGKPQPPLQAELIVPLDVTHLQVGSPVLAKVDADWQSAECRLTAGSMVRGHVRALTRRSKAERNSGVQVMFDAADCKETRDDAHRFILVALIGGLPSTGQSGVSEGQPLSNDLPMTIGGGGGGIRNAHAASAMANDFVLQTRKLPAHVVPGQVIDIERTSLELGAGPAEATTIRAVGRNLRLEAGTMLVLISASTVPSNAVVSANATKQPEPEAASARGAVPSPALGAEPHDVTEICSAACTTLSATEAGASLLPSRAAARLSLRRLGYPSPSPREICAFWRGYHRYISHGPFAVMHL